MHACLCIVRSLVCFFSPSSISPKPPLRLSSLHQEHPFFVASCLLLTDSRCSRGDLGPELGTFFSYRPGDGGALHLSLVVRHDSSIILEVDEVALCSPPRLSLSDDDCHVDFLAEIRLPFLHCREHQVPKRTCGQTVQATTPTLDTNRERRKTQRSAKRQEGRRQRESIGCSMLVKTHSSSQQEKVYLSSLVQGSRRTE